MIFASWKPPSLVSVSVMVRVPPGWNGSLYVPSKTEGPRFFSCAFVTPARNSDASSAEAARGPMPIRAAADAALMSTARRASSPSDGRRRADSVVRITASIAWVWCVRFVAAIETCRHQGACISMHYRVRASIYLAPVPAALDEKHRQDRASVGGARA